MSTQVSLPVGGTCRGSVRSTKHHGHFDRTRRHVKTLRGRIDNLIDCLHRKVEGHELANGPQARLHAHKVLRFAHTSGSTERGNSSEGAVPPPSRKQRGCEASLLIS